MPRLLRIAVLGGAILVVPNGCGKAPLHEVGGTVRLDGKPLADTLVSSISEDAERRFFLDRTDAQGRSCLQLDADRSGAAAGRYVIRVSTAQEPDGAGEAGGGASPELVPARYNVASQLRADVVAGRNDIPIELRSKPER